MKKFLRPLLAIICITTVVSCQKFSADKNSLRLPDPLTGLAVNTGTTAFTTMVSDGDTVDSPTILGIQLPNPYTIQNMKQAYTNITGQTGTPAVTDLYVRFKPANINQLRDLDSIMDAKDLDLFDEPLDYQVLQEGDYYQDPAVPGEEITWMYAVVPPSFQFPPGIVNQILASIHIPTNLRVEQEADRLAGLNADGDGLAGTGGAQAIQPNVAEDCLPGYVWDPIARACVKEQTGPPADPTYIPGGKIMVYDTQLDPLGGTTAQPVRTLRVVARRWFKVDRSYTSSTGNFQVTKKFRRKVKLIVKFKNQYAKIRAIQGVRLWQILIPLHKRIGTYSGSSINNVSYIFQPGAEAKTKARKFWIAAHIINGVQEHRDFTGQLGVSLAPDKLNIYTSNLTSNASTPLFKKRWIQTLPDPFVNETLVQDNMVIAGGISALAATLRAANIDMTIGYEKVVSTDALKETIYHEMSHGSHYSLAGAAFYHDFVDAEINEMIQHISDGYSPYGMGNDAYAPIIALGEGWAYFMGHFLADKKYGPYSSCAGEQGFCYSNGDLPGLNSHLIALEEFDPIPLDDEFHWIPKGLLYDLIDQRNEIGSPIADNVTGFSVSQLFNPLNGNIRSPAQYRDQLQFLNPGNQTVQITNLFMEYGY